MHDGGAGVHLCSYLPDNTCVNQRQFTGKEKLFRFLHNIEQKCKDATFFLRIILKRASTEAHVYMRRHQGAKVEHFDVSNVIYYKNSQGAVFYTLNGENVNVMLELWISINRIMDIYK